MDAGFWTRSSASTSNKNQFTHILPPGALTIDGGDDGHALTQVSCGEGTGSMSVPVRDRPF